MTFTVEDREPLRVLSGYRHDLQVFPPRLFVRLLAEFARLGAVIGFFAWVVAMIIAVAS